MKKTMIAIVFAMMMGIGFYTTEASAQMRYGGDWSQGYGPQQQGWYCPTCGRWEGPDWRRGQQYRQWYGPGYQGPRYQQPTQPLNEKEAEQILQNYIQSKRNPNLKLGTIEDKGSAFEAEIVTKKEGVLVDRVTVDKSTGWLRSVY
jgi:hypothetical protein